VSLARDPGADPDIAASVKAINFLADAGRQMLESSSSVSEILDRLREVMPAVGLEGCEVDATLSSLTLSLWRPGFPAPITAMRVIDVGAPRLERLAGTGALLDALERGHIDLDEASERLQQLEAKPATRVRYVSLAILLSVAGWVVFLDGLDLVTILVALAATVLVFPVQYVVDRLDLPRWSGTFLAALIIAAVPNLLLAAGVGVHVGPAVVGALYIYLPGRALVSSVIDGLANAPLSGLARGLEAVVTAGLLAIGMLVGAGIGAGLGLTYSPNTDAQPVVLTALAAGIGVLGLALAWGMPRDRLVPSAVVGGLGWLIVVMVPDPGAGSGWIASLLAALGVGLAGALLSTVQRTPTSVYTGVAILPLVPGLTLYQGMLAISQGDEALAFDKLGAALVLSISIAVGMAIGLALGRNTVRVGQGVRSGWRSRVPDHDAPR
jgi:uncharacterized membrane protein YjjP (DUF1212 family)